MTATRSTARILAAILCASLMIHASRSSDARTSGESEATRGTTWRRIVEHLDHDDATVRQRSHAALVAASDAAWPAIEAAWRNGEWPTRDRIAALLGDLDLERAHELRRMATTDPSWAVRATAARATAAQNPRGATPEDFEAVRRCVDDPVWAVRHAAVSALATFDEPQVVPILEHVLREDADPDVAAHAGRLLLELTDDLGRETLETIVRRTPVDRRAPTIDRIFASHATNEAVESFFRDRLDSDDPRQRHLASCWFVREGDPSVLDDEERFASLVRAAAGGADGPVADRAATTLLLLGPDAAPRLVALLPETDDLDADQVFRLVHSLLGDARNSSLVPLLADPRLAKHRDTILAQLSPVLDDEGFVTLREIYRGLSPDAEPVDPLRANLLRYLASTRADTMRDELVRELDSGDARARLVAMEELLQATTPETHALVLESLAREPAVFVRRRVLDAIASFDDAGSIAWVRSIARDDPDPRNRRKAIQTLALNEAVPEPSRVEFLRERLGLETEPDVRSAIVFSLGRFGGAAVTETLEVLAFSSDESWGVRRAAYDRIRRRAASESLDKLLDRLDSADRTRELSAIAAALSSYDDPRVCTRFGALIDSHPALRGELFELLERAQCRDERARLAAHVTDAQWSLRDRIAAAEQLAKIDTPAALEALVEATDVSSPFELRLTALAALGEREEPGAVAALRDFTNRQLAALEATGGFTEDASSEDASLLVESLVALARRGTSEDFADAVTIAIRALAKAPGGTRPSIASGTLVRILRAGNPENARTLFEAELGRERQATPLATAVLAASEGLRRAREPELAAVGYRHVLETGPRADHADFEASRRIAAWYERSERFEDAARAFARAFAIAVLNDFRPSDEATAPLQGFLPLIRLRGYRDVCRALARAQEREPAAPLAELEAVLRNAGADREIALACAQFAIDLELDPTFARNAAKIAYRIEPENPRIVVTYAESLARAGEPSDSAMLYERFAAGPILDRSTAASFFIRAAELRVASNEVQHALADLSEALARDDDAAETIRSRPAFDSLRAAGHLDDQGRPKR